MFDDIFDVATVKQQPGSQQSTHVHRQAVEIIQYPGVGPSCAFKVRATIRKTKRKPTAVRTRNHITQAAETCQIRVPSKINSAINIASGAIHNQRITRRPIETPAPTELQIIIGTFGGKQASAPCHDPAYNRRPRPVFGCIQTTIGDALVTLSFW